MKIRIDSTKDFYSLDEETQAKILKFLVVMFMMNTAVQEGVEQKAILLPSYEIFNNEHKDINDNVNIDNAALPDLLALALDKFLTGKMGA
jgi:hypothetical protein